MTKQYVYLAGPIYGCSYDEAVGWRREVCDSLLPGIVGISPMRMKEFLEKNDRIGHHYSHEPIVGAPMPIASRDFFDVQKTDAILAYIPQWSTSRRPACGTLLELGAAIAWGKPIILISDDERICESPLIIGKVGWQLRSLAEGIAAVNSILAGYR
jgi:nucleoside 2-deoxyribosyltransferase